MNRTELAELIRNGESSGVEFKRDDVAPEKLAKEMAALLNLEGGHILLGVEKDGTVTGLTRSPEKAEEWAMEIARIHLRPAAIPFWETIPWGDGKVIGILSLPRDAPDKPYKARRGSAWVTQIRVGTTSSDASDDEEARLYMQSGRLQYDRKPVPGARLDDLDRRRLVNYFRDIRQQDCPDEDDRDAWIRLLVNTELMVQEHGPAMPSVGGLLLFGSRPKRYLPQAGISAVAYTGAEKDYDAKARPPTLRGPIVSLYPAAGENAAPIHARLPRTFSETERTLEAGVIEQALDFVRRNIEVNARIGGDGARRECWDYPLEAVRETLVNAVAHRDYSITVIDIELSIYADRLEVISPGRLPNTVTVEKMRAGYRASRNELVKEVLRDYRYIEATGLGVPRKIVRGMREHNGTEVDLIEDDDRFIVRLALEGARSHMIPKECKRLAEVDFPIAVVSKDAAKEKSIRHGHPSTLHLWWAHRPLASSRAVLLALLLPDPCDTLCPVGFKDQAREFLPLNGCGRRETDDALRKGLLKFIGDFANWDLATQATYLEVSRGPVKAAHPEETPLVVDPFAGGGPSPWRPCAWAARHFCPRPKPLARLILKVMLEDIPVWMGANIRR